MSFFKTYFLHFICNIFAFCAQHYNDDELAKVIKQLSDRYRENVLMYYFLDMSDTEIAKLQNISRSGVFQNRHYALKQMKKSLEEGN